MIKIKQVVFTVVVNFNEAPTPTNIVQLKDRDKVSKGLFEILT